jgi:heterodisulfide reductase subunit A
VLTLLSRDTVVASGFGLRGQRERLRFLRRLHHGLHLRRHRFHSKRPKGRKASVNPVLCKGDGLCNTKCPTGAIF